MGGVNIRLKRVMAAAGAALELPARSHCEGPQGPWQSQKEEGY
mgnify:CR=1